MIIVTHGHDHIMMTSWRACFLAWSSWFMTWLPSSCFSWFSQWPCVFHVFSSTKMEYFFMFSQLVAAIYSYIAKLTGVRWDNAYKLPIQQNWTKITPEIEISSVITRKQVLIWQQFQYNIYITAFYYFWQLRSFGKNIHFQLTVFWVVSVVFVQHIPR